MKLHSLPPDLIQEWKKSGQVNEEEQDTLLRLSAIMDNKQPRTEEETKQRRDEVEALCSRLRLLEAERLNDPILKATLVASEVALIEAEKKAKEAGLSLLAVHIAGLAAGSKARCESLSEAQELIGSIFLGPFSNKRWRITPIEITAAVVEVKQAGLWPSWEGVN